MVCLQLLFVLMPRNVLCMSFCSPIIIYGHSLKQDIVLCVCVCEKVSVHFTISDWVCELRFLVINMAGKQPFCGVLWANTQPCLFAFSILVFARLASAPGVWLDCSWAPASHAWFPPYYAELLFLIKQAHKATFLEFFMCKLFSVFLHAWMVCTEKCRPQH